MLRWGRLTAGKASVPARLLARPCDLVGWCGADWFWLVLSRPASVSSESCSVRFVSFRSYSRCYQPLGHDAWSTFGRPPNSVRRRILGAIRFRVKPEVCTVRYSRADGRARSRLVRYRSRACVFGCRTLGGRRIRRRSVPVRVLVGCSRERSGLVVFTSASAAGLFPPVHSSLLRTSFEVLFAVNRWFSCRSVSSRFHVFCPFRTARSVGWSARPRPFGGWRIHFIIIIIWCGVWSVTRTVLVWC